MRLSTAVSDLNKGKFVEGMRLLKEIVHDDPASAAAHLNLAIVYSRMGRRDVAYRHLEHARQAKLGDGLYFVQLGMLRRHEGCRPEARAAFRRGLEAGAGREEAAAWRNIGDIEVEMLAPEKALDAYENAIRIEPNDAQARLALGRLHLDRNDAQNAVVQLRRALELDPALAGAHAALGRAYRMLGDWDSAIASLKKGLDADPSDQDSRYILGQLLLALGREEEGRRELGEYSRLQDRVLKTNRALEAAVERARAGQYDRAEELLKETLELAPRYGAAMHIMGIVLLSRGDAPHALNFLRQSLIANPLNPETYFNLSTAYFRIGKHAEALEMIERALVLDDEDARFHAHAGDVYSKTNQPDRAQASLRRAAELRSRPGYREPDPYASEERRRSDAAIVRAVCGL